MPVNIAETFESLFDKNNSVAYKALQELQKDPGGTGNPSAGYGTVCKQSIHAGAYHDGRK